MIYGGSRRTFLSILAVGAVSVSSPPALADSTDLAVGVPDCKGCTLTAVHSVHRSWDAIDTSVMWRKSAKVRKGVARFSIPTAKTRGLSFALDAGKFDGGGSVPMVVLRYANRSIGSRVGWFASAQGRRASYCWAGTESRRATLKVRTERSVNRLIPPGAPGRYTIRAWASRTQPTLRDDVNMMSTNDGALDIQQGPYCIDSDVTASAAVASRVPTGGSVWIKPVGGTYQMLRLWRSGSNLRIYRDEGKYPGDGMYCSWGNLRGKKFVGMEQGLAPDPVAVRYTIRKGGGRLKVFELTGSMQEDRLPWRRGSVQKYFQLVPDAIGNTGEWCRTFKPMG